MEGGLWVEKRHQGPQGVSNYSSLEVKGYPLTTP